MQHIHLLNGDCWAFGKGLSTEQVLREMSIELQVSVDRMRLTESIPSTESPHSTDLHFHLLLLDSPDYPFTDFSTYFHALSLSLMNPDAVRESHPRYHHALDHCRQADHDILLELLDRTDDPQTALHGLVHALLRGRRYACDLIPFLIPVIDEMQRRGAQWSDELYAVIANGQIDVDDLLQIKASLLRLALRGDKDKERWLRFVPEWESIVPSPREEMMDAYPNHEHAYRRALKFEVENHQN